MTAGSGGRYGQEPSPGGGPAPDETGTAAGLAGAQPGHGAGDHPASTPRQQGQQGQQGQRKLVAVESDVPLQRAPGGVLADRMAAALVHREPGWQLPRRSALARRYNVSMAEIDVAIGELARRALIRRLPDGQLYRASPAEYLIPVEGVGGLSTRLDPMGAEITCQTRHVSQREAPQDVAWTLGVGGETHVRIIRCVWAVDAEPAAVSTTYVPGEVAGPLGDPAADDVDTFQAVLRMPLGARPGVAPVTARAVDLELAPPQPSVARSLRLLPGQPAYAVTIRFDDSETGKPAGLTTIALKPDQFRVVIHAGDALPGGPHIAE
ncbi:MAG TPA: UTRA domain-containing protein [Trebonia sp.]|nr:UTRA domain-containing protein [Trebonia sp.]